ncbi:MAG: LytTR family transcriptional regulator [Rikenellaceae bacterium]|jgi:DNA-binding LytR/AlgR family response regulator|nr:LytTR family transcriptional regulator [Rikenellaceae bacterium]
MFHPYLKNGASVTLYVLVWGALAVAIAVALALGTTLPFGDTLTVGAILSGVFCALAMLQWNVLLYARRINTNRTAWVLCNLAVGALFLACWGVASCLLLSQALPDAAVDLLLPAAPLLALVGTLTYIIVAQGYLAAIAQAEQEDAEPVIEKAAAQPAGTSAEPVETLERIATKVGQKIEITLVDDIRYIKSEGDYVMIYTEAGHFLKEQTMKYFENRLPVGQFVRIHRCYIVNVRAISRVERYDKQELMIVLTGGKKLRASVSGYRELKRILDL